MNKKDEDGQETKVCPFKIWCCGDLRTATISIGVTNIVSLILLTSYKVGTTLSKESFNLNILVIPLLVVITVFINIALVYGATKRFKWIYIPWMVTYLPAILALLIFCSVKFSTLEGQQLSFLVLVFVSAYFYAVVVSSYVELTQNSRIQKNQTEKSKKHESKDYIKDNGLKKPAFLIDLTEMESLNETNRLGDTSVCYPNGTRNEADETFTHIANREPLIKATDGEAVIVQGFDDSGEFTLPHVDESHSSDQLNFSTCFTTADSKLLPVPEEVIQIEKLVDKGSELPSVQTTYQERTIDLSFKSLSTVDVSFKSQKSLSAKSESRIMIDPLKNVVNMDLVDSTFSPFKAKSGTDSSQLPKMKIFLPKNASDEDDSSKSSSNEDLPAPESH